MENPIFTISIGIILFLTCVLLYFKFKREQQIKTFYQNLISGKTGINVYYYDDKGEKFNGKVLKYTKSSQIVTIKNKVGNISYVLITNVYPSILN